MTYRRAVWVPSVRHTPFRAGAPPAPSLVPRRNRPATPSPRWPAGGAGPIQARAPQRAGLPPSLVFLHPLRPAVAVRVDVAPRLVIMLPTRILVLHRQGVERHRRPGSVAGRRARADRPAPGLGLSASCSRRRGAALEGRRVDEGLPERTDLDSSRIIAVLAAVPGRRRSDAQGTNDSRDRQRHKILANAHRHSPSDFVLGRGTAPRHQEG